jgi:hypothetical protein
MPSGAGAAGSRTARRTGTETALATPTRNAANDDDNVEEVHIQFNAVDPGGETRDAEGPAAGYPSDNEADAPPIIVIEEVGIDDDNDDDANEPALEEAEAVVGDDCCVPAHGTAASGAAAADAAIAATIHSSGSGKAGKLTWARVNRARAGYDANQHTFTDPIWRGTEKTETKHRADCQWCKFKWIENGKQRPDGCKAAKYEGPQNKEVMYCTRCGVHLCSASCWNEFHGLE